MRSREKAKMSRPHADLQVDRDMAHLLPIAAMLVCVRAWSVFLVSLFAMLLVPRLVRAQCVDESLKEELIGGRHCRGVQARLFTKPRRHENPPMGGWSAADLYSGAPVYGG